MNPISYFLIRLTVVWRTILWEIHSIFDFAEMAVAGQVLFF
jgi:hypothetical protein